MRNIRILREAAEEAIEAAAHYEGEHNGLGVQFEDAVHDALHLLSEDEMVPLSNVSESLQSLLKRNSYHLTLRIEIDRRLRRVLK